MVLEAAGDHAVNEEHAREVAAIEAMMGAYFEPVTADRSIAQLVAQRINRFSHPINRDRLWWASQEQWWDSGWRDFQVFGTVLVGQQWSIACFDEVAEIPESIFPQMPKRVMDRPRKVAPKPGRKFSGMTRFSWRQR